MSSELPIQSSAQQRRKLELLAKNVKANPDSREEFLEMIDRRIKDEKMPFTYKLEDDGSVTILDLQTQGQLHLERFITVDQDTIELKRRARESSLTDYDLLISGPTGTGKEIIARSQIGKRTGKFMAINCAGMPETLIESILFGHVKGAFTGAYTDKKGFMQEAQDGVMFLDEVGELPLLMQAKLLRAIQEKVICRVGSTVEESINLKFVYATNQNLEEMVEKKLFRADLYARISMLNLSIKSLNERLCDCVPIAQSIKDSAKFIDKHGDALKEGLLPLPHNVRSIQQMIVRFNVWGDIK